MNRKILACALAFGLVGSAGRAEAQCSNNLDAAPGTAASCQAEVRANVQAALTMTVTGATDFGTVNAAQGSATINPAAPTPGTTTALFSASGEPGLPVIVSFNPSVTLFNSSEASMAFAPVVGAASTNTQSLATPITSGATVVLSQVVGGVGGASYFWLGGTLTIRQNQPSGAYSGFFTLNVEYSSL